MNKSFIEDKNFDENFKKNFVNVMPIFYEMQSTFLSGIYRRYGDLDGANIIVYFAKNLHLEVLRLREKELDLSISLDRFWDNHKKISQPKHKIISIARSTGLPKETTRRKILDLIKKKHLKKVDKGSLSWSPVDELKTSYIKIIDEEIIYLSKFIFQQAKLLGLEISFSKINKEMKSNFSFYWYHYLDAQLKYMYTWQTSMKDLELLVILLQCLIQTFNFISKKGIEPIANLNKKSLKNIDLSEANISATSISEVTGIPRATCIRKLKIFEKNNVLKKDINNKRYYVSLDDDNNEIPVLRDGIVFSETSKIFCNLCTTTLKGIIKEKN